MEPFLKVTAILVKQPLGDFFICKIKAEDLLKITFSSEFRIKEEENDHIEFVGNQRKIKTPKSKSIGIYIDSIESAFPNSIILAANFDEEGREINDDGLKWEIQKVSDDVFDIIIPTHQKVTSIIDGQHRLDGFRYINNMDRLNTELVCSVYFGLPISYQAYLFANINGTQTPVTKNMTYNLYGFNLQKEKKESWSPEKLSVFITRTLNFTKNSIFYKRIKISPTIDNELLNPTHNWFVSTATMVEGIVALFSKNPKRDQDYLAAKELQFRDRYLLKNILDSSPLRSFYLSGDDIVIEKCIENFFNTVDRLIFSEQGNDSFIFKNIGFKALLNVLNKDLTNQLKNKEIDITENYYTALLQKIKGIDFADDYFRIASYVGKSRIENVILFGLGLISIDQVKNESDRNSIYRILNIN